MSVAEFPYLNIDDRVQTVDIWNDFDQSSIQIIYSPTKRSENKNNLFALGDGYKSSFVFGLNSVRPEWSVEISSTGQDTDDLEVFFTKYCAEENYLFGWIPPDSENLSRWRIDEWSASKTGPAVTIFSTTLRRVYELTQVEASADPIICENDELCDLDFGEDFIGSDFWISKLTGAVTGEDYDDNITFNNSIIQDDGINFQAYIHPTTKLLGLVKRYPGGRDIWTREYNYSFSGFDIRFTKRISLEFVNYGKSLLMAFQADTQFITLICVKTLDGNVEWATSVSATKSGYLANYIGVGYDPTYNYIAIGINRTALFFRASVKFINASSGAMISSFFLNIESLASTPENPIALSGEASDLRYYVNEIGVGVVVFSTSFAVYSVECGIDGLPIPQIGGTILDNPTTVRRLANNRVTAINRLRDNTTAIVVREQVSVGGIIIVNDDYSVNNYAQFNVNLPDIYTNLTSQNLAGEIQLSENGLYLICGGGGAFVKTNSYEINKEMTKLTHRNTFTDEGTTSFSIWRPEKCAAYNDTVNRVVVAGGNISNNIIVYNDYTVEIFAVGMRKKRTGGKSCLDILSTSDSLKGRFCGEGTVENRSDLGGTIGTRTVFNASYDIEGNSYGYLEIEVTDVTSGSIWALYEIDQTLFAE
jgi:phage-related protein